MEWNNELSLEDKKKMSKAVEESKKNDNLEHIRAAKELMSKYGYDSPLNLIRKR